MGQGWAGEVLFHVVSQRSFRGTQYTPDFDGLAVRLHVWQLKAKNRRWKCQAGKAWGHHSVLGAAKTHPDPPPNPQVPTCPLENRTKPSTPKLQGDLLVDIFSRKKGA